MFLTRTVYERRIVNFSPDGRLFQVEYPIEAIKLGSTAIGLKTKSCLRSGREEAKKIQSAKAEAESRELEQQRKKMRSDLKEKLRKRMADMHRKAEEWRAAAQFHHSEQIRKVDRQARKAKIRNNNRHFSGNK